MRVGSLIMGMSLSEIRGKISNYMYCKVEYRSFSDKEFYLEKSRYSSYQRGQ
jgi:hypothetical protein